jgi:hypothetical protein
VGLDLVGGCGTVRGEVANGLLGRKTEEGFLIYKEAELGINPEAGGGCHIWRENEY